MIIRKANEMDAESIVSINIDGWKETYFGIFPGKFLDTLEQKYKESVEKCKRKISEYVICEIEGEIVGFLRFGENKKGYNNEYAEVYALYIDSKHKRKGVGRNLLEYSFNLMKANYNNVLISTLQQNSANEFYKKCGGKLIDTCDFKLDNNLYKENLYLFSLK